MHKTNADLIFLYGWCIYKIIIIFFFHSLICILFHVKTKWLPEQHLKPIESQNGVNDG